MRGPYPAKVLDWHDGDTCHMDVDLGFGEYLLAYDIINGKVQWSCRIFGINAPELSNKPAGPDSLAYAEQICPPGTIVQVTSHGFDKYGGRFDGQITLPTGEDFAALMLAAGQAVVEL